MNREGQFFGRKGGDGYSIFKGYVDIKKVEGISCGIRTCIKPAVIFAEQTAAVKKAGLIGQGHSRMAAGQNHFGQLFNPFLQLVNVLWQKISQIPKFAQIQACRLQLSADGGLPLFFDAVNAEQDAKKRAGRGGCAVRVLSAVDRKADGFSEIPFSIQKGEDDHADIGRSLPAGAAVDESFFSILFGNGKDKAAQKIAQDFISCLHPGNPSVIQAFRKTDCFCNGAFLRNIRQADVNERADIMLHKRGAFHRGAEGFGVEPFPFSVIHQRIPAGIGNGGFRASGSKAGPDFGTDISAAAVGVRIVVGAAEGRLDPHAHIDLAVAVFRPVRRDIIHPVISESPRVDMDSFFFQSDQPDELNVHIVVGKRLPRDLMGIIRYMIDAAVPFIPHPESSSGVLPQKTAENPVSVFVSFVVQSDPSCLSCCGYGIMPDINKRTFCHADGFIV